MRKTKFAPGEFYHIYNRGNNKQIIFSDTRDWVRFLFITLYFQSTVPIYNISSSVTSYIKHSVFNVSNETLKKIDDSRVVELVGFSHMPNHFHLLLIELREGGVSQFMQRVQNSYTKYFNSKYRRNGHLFQGPFQAIHVKDNRQVLHLSTYIHRNPREILGWKNKEDRYPWSSYPDFIRKNRWGILLKHQHITEQFNTPLDYKKFVEKSSAKSLKKEYIIEE